ncbi:MAG: metal-dependent transcriptional regulator [Deltaproteobacteria bacterium]|nr:metal-dependent transcriptional regulator [Deltaproteobacteria bacterium]
MERIDREEAMELVGTLEEKGEVRREDLQAEHLHHPLSSDQIDFLCREKLIDVDGGGRVRSTAEGKVLAERIIRRHRLAERLISDVLVVKNADLFEESACDLEHVLTEELTDSICTLLGHPTACPHGRPIPPGACCSEKRTRLKSLIAPLDELATGAEGKIAYISTGDHERLDQLTSMGLFPGTTIKVHQRQPALVILFEETTLALDREIAREVHVWRQSARE